MRDGIGGMGEMKGEGEEYMYRKGNGGGKDRMDGGDGGWERGIFRGGGEIGKEE